MELIAALIFSCSAQGLLIQVERLGGGVLRYTAFAIPGDLRRPALLIDGGTRLSEGNGGALYRFQRGSFRYDVIPEPGYGRVDVFQAGRRVDSKACGDV